MFQSPRLWASSNDFKISLHLEPNSALLIAIIATPVRNQDRQTLVEEGLAMDRTREAVVAQISAMECSVFELGLYKTDPEPSMLPRTWDVDTLVRSINWLKHQNQAGRNIYVRPNGEHQLSLVDDLKREAVGAMKRSGFQPALVLETSPGNFQAWMKHPEALPKDLGTAVARALAEKFGGDTGAADWRHFGRLAGFTNRKPKYLDIQTGLYPFVRLSEANGKVYSQAERFVSDVQARLERERQERQHLSELWGRRASDSKRDRKAIDQFRRDQRYFGDNTRIDLAYAVYALSHDVAADEVKAALRSRDLSHKGNERRQNEYVERTIRKALHTIEGIGRGM
jgi:RepB DNA-primase from phage plasmid